MMNQQLGMNLKTVPDAVLTSALRDLSVRERKITTEVVAHVAEFMSRKLYLNFGYSSVFAYLTEELRYSGSTAQNRIEAARLLLNVPELQNDFASGAINLTQASLVARAIRQSEAESDNGMRTTPDETRDLIDKIRHCDTKQTAIVLAQELDLNLKTAEVIRHQKDESVSVHLTFTKEQFEVLQSVKDVSSHVTSGGSLAEVLAYVMTDYLKRKGGAMALKGNAQVKIGSAISQKEQNMEAPEASLTADPQWRPSAKQRKAIPIAIRREVLSTNDSCVYVDGTTEKRCGSRHLLQIDHVQSVWRGGSNGLENLQPLCAPHNRMKYLKGG